jgi:hypothetical protein
MKKRNSIQSGSALLPFVIVVPFLILISTYFMDLAVGSFKLARRDQLHTHSQFAADAGIDYALDQINQDTTWTGTGTELELHNDSTTRTTYQVSVITNASDSKTMTATGRSYSPATNPTPTTSVTLKVELRPVESGNYSIVSGVGGLILSNSAKIIGGDVFINGRINLSNTAQIGLTNNPVNVQVAHQSCPSPADATYPRLCASGEYGEPISILNSAKIYGSVRANNQTTGTAMSDPGLIASSGVTAQPLPNHDRNAQKAAVTITENSAWANCNSNVTRTWPANLKITGNVTISGMCKIIISGDVWITGTLAIQNSGQLIVADSLGATIPDVMVDGATTLLKNGALLKSNASNTGMQIISYWSRASCSPDCSNVTGVDLFNSSDDISIELQNSASGPQSIFYSRWTKVTVTNSGQIGALVGQTVELKNSGTITFGSTASPGGEQFWVIDKYRRSF